MNFIINFLFKIINIFLSNKDKKINIISKKEIDIEVEKNLDNNTENVCSRYFTLEEITKSETAVRQGIQNIPSKDQIFQTQQLCSVIMDRIRSHYNKPIRILSGYRCQELNKVIGGSKSSQHMALNNDAAIDFEFYDHHINLESVFHWITQISDIHFDQCIAEFLPEGWIHISYNTDSEKNRGKITRATKINNKTFYEQLGYAKWI
ncbi:hypothetical protein CL621_00915 [archaeon]|nr:hypothetical protein [archaeon]|tara:strand:- start:362 stop:979 length:618 start_codon:yes stop_codon:yes gene_type:complete